MDLKHIISLDRIVPRIWLDLKRYSIVFKTQNNICKIPYRIFRFKILFTQYNLPISINDQE